MLSKSILLAGRGYVKITLDEKETAQAMDELLKFNMNEMSRVIKATKEISMADMNLADMRRMLFEKQGMASFTFLQIKLDQKIEAERKAMGKD